MPSVESIRVRVRQPTCVVGRVPKGRTTLFWVDQKFLVSLGTGRPLSKRSTSQLSWGSLYPFLVGDDIQLFPFRTLLLRGAGPFMAKVLRVKEGVCPKTYTERCQVLLLYF